MILKKLSVSNFKSFKHSEIELEKFNVLIGANASGKSNFVQLFKFIRDVKNFGLDNAISMQGGIDYFLNNRLGQSEKFSIEIEMEGIQVFPPMLISISSEKQVGFVIRGLVYTLEVKFGRSMNQSEILKEEIYFYTQFQNMINDRNGLNREAFDNLGAGSIKIFREKNNIDLRVDADKYVMKQYEEDNIFVINSTKNMLNSRKLSPMETILQMPYMMYLGTEPGETFANISVYDFDPKMSKKAQPITGKVDLEEDGSNLTILLNNILKGRDRQKFYNVLNSILPFIDKIHTKKFANNLIFQFREKYHHTKSLPSFLVSDGTINLTALVVALFHQSKPVKIIEEPERNIHPYVISKIVDLMRDASEDEQIITTSHNPEIVRYAEPHEIFLVYRNKEGFTDISKPIKKKEIEMFLDKEMGMSELFVQRLLETYIE